MTSFFGLKKYWVQIVDEFDIPITTGITVDIQSAGVSKTIFSDASKAAKTNPIVTTITNGVVEWFDVTGATFDIVVTGRNQEGRRIGLTDLDHRFVFQQSLNQMTPMVDFLDDFFIYDDTAAVGKYQETSDGGTIIAVDGLGGVLSIATTGTIEDESYVSSLFSNHQFNTTDKLVFETRVKLTEANTNDANIIVGLSDTVGANTLLDSGGGPPASYDGAVFYKLFDELVWNFEGSNAATQDTETSIGTFTSATWHTLRFEYDPSDGVTATITPSVDGVAGTAVTILIAGLAAQMRILLGVKAGGGNAETLLVDYVRVSTPRGNAT